MSEPKYKAGDEVIYNGNVCTVVRIFPQGIFFDRENVYYDLECTLEDTSQHFIYGSVLESRIGE